jgi:hypothetical protein
MANNNSPMGLRPITNNAGVTTGRGRLVSFAANDSNNIFLGDPLVPTGVADAFGVPIVTIATAGAANTILGAFNGIANGPAKAGNAASTITRDLPVYRQASILNYGFCLDDPNQLYVAQEDSLPLSAGFIAAANGGFTNVNLIAGAGSTVTGFSGWLLDSSSDDGNANPTFQIRIIGLLRAPDNAIGNYAKWLCRINLPALWGASGY